MQHAGLRDSFAADAFTVDALVKLVQFLFPDVNYKWLVHEVKHSLPKVGLADLMAITCICRMEWHQRHFAMAAY